MRAPCITFADLAVGTEFEFASIRDFPFSGFKHGPWIKISIRKYVLKDSPNFKCRVGTINTEVIPTLATARA